MRLKAYLIRALQPAQLSIAFLCIVSGVTVLQLRPWLISAAMKSAATVDMAGRAMTNLDGASKSMKIAADNETKYLQQTIPQIASRINGTIDNANAVLSDLRGPIGRMDGLAGAANQVLISTKSRIDELQPVIDQSRQSIQGLQPLESDLDVVIKNPEIPQTIHNVQEVTANVDGTTKDVQGAVHSYLHPTWAQKLKSLLLNSGVEVAKFFW